ncbi:hypothetical protein [Streptomyces sp. NPDC008150]|uniref:hypothetical protein n=1 Tax=Streptomyces sp. NPDC008150 TaxID=3364816 RepID=UPI0036E99C06
MQDPSRRAVRTTIQTLVAAVAVLPLLAGTPGLADLPAFTALVAAATALSRLMSTPAVERLLPAWLSGTVSPDTQAGPEQSAAEGGDADDGR